MEQASSHEQLKMQELGGVRGRYLVGASLQPQEHAIVVVIGSIVIWGVVNATPLRTLRGLDGTYGFGQHSIRREMPWSLFRKFAFQLSISDVSKVGMLTRSRHPFQLALPHCIPFGVGWHST